MIRNISYHNNYHTRHMILQHVYEQRRINPAYSVIDIGGSAGSWTHDIRDCLVDYIAPPSGDRVLALDICSLSAWEQLRAVVHRRGAPFDFAICTHTLEDLYNPFLALDHLPSIAQGGVISMPSLRTELYHHAESAQGYWLGYYHHHWMFDQDSGHDRMIIAPKLPLLEILVRNEYAVTPDSAADTIMYQWDHVPDPAHSGACIPYHQGLLHEHQGRGVHDVYREFIGAYSDPQPIAPATLASVNRLRA
jgi:hypothetical protein